MNVTRREAVAAIGLGTAAAAAHAQAAGERIVIPGVDRYRVVEPVFEGIRVILSKRGEHWSPDYIQGISGAAFRIAGPCPCAPTCAMAMSPEALIKLLGYTAESIPAPDAGEDEQAWLRATLARVKDEVRAGRPALVFHAFTKAEWDVACGFDETTKELVGRGSYVGPVNYSRADEARTLQSKPICGIVGPILIGAKTGTFDARAAEIAALREAVRFAHDTAKKVPYPGLQCYEKWLAAYTANPPAKPDFPRDGYTSMVYRSTQRAAAAFLREIAPRYPAAADHLLRGAAHFAQEAAALSAFHELLFPTVKPRETAAKSDQTTQAAAYLTKAREAYRSGIEELARSMPNLIAGA